MNNSNALAYQDDFASLVEFKTQISFSQLSGEGIELGALHNPLLVDFNKAHVLYADRLSREQALDRMVAQAEANGANAIVGVRFATSEMMDHAAELLAYGTAVVLEDI